MEKRADEPDALNLPNAFKKVYESFVPPRVTLPTSCNALAYKMNHKNRGKCIIINNKNFLEGLGNVREGTDIDADNLTWTFQKLGFDVERYNDLWVHQMKNCLKRAAKEDHTESDCIVCCILSHGDEDTVNGCDGRLPIEDIYEPFVGDRCNSLVGKPKLFFVQACKGDKCDKGVNVLAFDSILEYDSASKMKIPTHADFLWAFSTVPGFYSWRNFSNGSWFIQALCAVLNEHGSSMHLLDMMILVNHQVAYNFQSHVPEDRKIHKKKQVPYIAFTLTRKVFFPRQSDMETLPVTEASGSIAKSGDQELS